MKKILFTLIILTACSEKKEINTSFMRDKQVTTNLIKNKPTIKSQPFTFKEIKIKGDTIYVSIYSSGCSGSSWKMDLINHKSTKNLKFRLDNQELCEAYINKTFEFNIENLKVKEKKKILLKIENYSKIITYKY